MIQRWLRCTRSWDWLRLDKGREFNRELACEPLRKEQERGSSLERAAVDKTMTGIEDIHYPPLEGRNEETSHNLTLGQQRRRKQHAQAIRRCRNRQKAAVKARAARR